MLLKISFSHSAVGSMFLSSSQTSRFAANESVHEFLDELLVLAGIRDEDLCHGIPSSDLREWVPSVRLPESWVSAEYESFPIVVEYLIRENR